MSQVIDSADRHLREALHLLRDEHDTRLAAFEQEIAPLKRRIKAIESALSPSDPLVPVDTADAQKALPAWSGRPALRPSVAPARDWENILKGLSQPEALVRIAQERDGIIRTAETKRILIDSKQAEGNPKNVIGHILSLLRDVDRFEKLGVRWEKVEPGVYRLVHITEESAGDVSDQLSERANNHRSSGPGWSY